MNDCTNAEMRDRLPDLLHADLATLDEVRAHVKDCVDCQDELDLLRSVRASIERQTPRVDVAYIVGALPKAPRAPSTSTVVPIATRRRTWTDWRVAAAVTLLIAGGSSAALLRSPAAVVPSTLPEQVAAPVVAAPDANVAVSTNPSAPTTGEANASASPTARPSAAGDQAAVEIGNNRLDDLSEAQLKSLLGEIDKLQPVPVAEPEPASLKVNAKVSSEIL